jgi:hypothetical protein
MSASIGECGMGSAAGSIVAQHAMRPDSIIISFDAISLTSIQRSFKFTPYPLNPTPTNLIPSASQTAASTDEKLTVQER